jgi:polysaccharide export outer membrane protein
MKLTTTESSIQASIAGAKRVRMTFVFALGILIMAAGCEAPNTSAPLAANVTQPDEQTLQEGDVIKVSFPGTPTLQAEPQTVRLDGRVTLPILGEVVVRGETPSALEKELSKRYANQLLSNEVVVTVVSSSAAYFVSGEVLRPGKITPDRPISALEAIMEAGGFNTDQADTKAVVVIRKENGVTHNYTLNLQLVLDGKDNKQFFLKPFDIVYVPRKFSMF